MRAGVGYNFKSLIQFFLYAFFYVSRMTNLTTPRSAPDIKCKSNAVGEIYIFVNNDKQSIGKIGYIRICPNVALDTSYMP
jgi:hypothetical protein